MGRRMRWELWDLDGAIWVACGFHRGWDEHRSLDKVVQYGRKGVLGNLGEESLRVFGDKRTRRRVACVSTACGDRVGSGVGHIVSGAIETRPRRCNRRRNEELVTREAFDDEHRLSAVWAACWLSGRSGIPKRCSDVEQGAATQ